jgi:Uma2 family endonuclease
MIAQPHPSRTRMTNAEYFALPETNRLVELWDGELIEMAPPTTDHQTASINLIVLLHTLIPDGRLFHAPTDVVFGEGYVPQPDVMWVAAGSRCVIDKKRLIGPPDLIIEILSPSTEANDRSDKYTLYERHGVREYWIVNPEHRFIEVYTHDGSGFARRGVFIAGQNETFESPVLGKPVPLAPIFA